MSSEAAISDVVQQPREICVPFVSVGSRTEDFSALRRFDWWLSSQKTNQT